MLSFQKPEPAIPPTVAVDGEIYRKRKNNRLKVSFSNPNNYALSIVEISLPGIEFVTPLPLRVQPNQVGCLEATIDATGVSEILIDLQGTFTMRHRFGKEISSVGLKIETEVDPVFLDTVLGDNQWTRRTGRWEKSRVVSRQGVK